MYNKKGIMQFFMDYAMLYVIVILLIVTVIFFIVARVAGQDSINDAVELQYRGLADVFIVNYLRSPVSEEVAKETGARDIADLIGGIVSIDGALDFIDGTRILSDETDRLFGGADFCFRLTLYKEGGNWLDKILYCPSNRYKGAVGIEDKVLLPLTNEKNAELQFEVWR